MQKVHCMNMPGLHKKPLWGGRHEIPKHLGEGGPHVLVCHSILNTCTCTCTCMYIMTDFTGGQGCGWGKPCMCMHMYTLYCSTCAYLSVVCAVCVLAPEICGDWPLRIPHAPHLRVQVCVCTCVCEECPSYTVVYIVYMCTSLRPYRVLIVVGSVHHCTSLYM